MPDLAAGLEIAKFTWDVIKDVATLFENSVQPNFNAGNAVPKELSEDWSGYQWKNTQVFDQQIYRFFAKNRFWPTDDEVLVHLSYTYGEVWSADEKDYLGNYMQDLTLGAELVTEAAPSTIKIDGHFGDPRYGEAGAEVTVTIMPPVYTYLKQQYGGGRGKVLICDAEGNTR